MPRLGSAREKEKKVIHILAATTGPFGRLPTVPTKLAFVVVLLICGLLAIKGSSAEIWHGLVFLILGAMSVAFFPVIGTWTAKVAGAATLGTQGPSLTATAVLIILVLISLVMVTRERRRG